MNIFVWMHVTDQACVARDRAGPGIATVKLFDRQAVDAFTNQREFNLAPSQNAELVNIAESDASISNNNALFAR
jgi:hypothetical protein